MKIKIIRRKTTATQIFYWKEDFIRLYQKTGQTDFDELWATDSNS